MSLIWAIGRSHADAQGAASGLAHDDVHRVAATSGRDAVLRPPHGIATGFGVVRHDRVAQPSGEERRRAPGHESQGQSGGGQQCSHDRRLHVALPGDQPMTLLALAAYTAVVLLLAATAHALEEWTE